MINITCRLTAERPGSILTCEYVILLTFTLYFWCTLYYTVCCMKLLAGSEGRGVEHVPAL